MVPAIQVGTARSRPGQIVYGVFDAVPLPTGNTETLPVIIAQGASGTGPVLWLTANIHGGEYNGMAVIHQLITPELIKRLTGAIVAVPSLNPAGLRTGERRAYYLRSKDPNRLFPAFNNSHAPFPPAMEQAYARLFERIDATADFLIDLHDYGLDALPFVFRDPVFYREPRDKPGAHKLHGTLGEMLRALGLTIINEYLSDEYLKLDLHRSVSGSTLNLARIPAATVEVGGQQRVNTTHVRAVAAGIRNVLRWARMLPGAREPVNEVTVIDPGYPVRRITHPRVPVACLVQFLVEPGQVVVAGDAVAHMADIYGRPVGTSDGLLRSEYDGFVIGLFPGLTFYPNDPVMGLAVRDTSDRVIRLPEN
ncbi:MAG: succinylglutamate desuccinylase/aspartoacylase family protein [Chloroflexi bacterium]|nr:succinylglutamate desuccinylase/aspartoacylase family protein [Chloroflexota bacterium]